MNAREESRRAVQALYLRAAGASEVARLQLRARSLPKMTRVLERRACAIALAPRGQS